MLIEEFNKGKHNIDIVKDLVAMAVGSPTPEKLRQLVDEFYGSSNHALFIITHDDNPIGIIGIDYTNKPSGYITHLAVSPDSRKHGIGRQLINYLGKAFKLTNIEVETDQDAVGFYSACGFTMVEIDSRWPGVHRFKGVKIIVGKKGSKYMTTPIEQLEAKGKAAKAAGRKLAFVSTEVKNRALLNIAESLLAKKAKILAANAIDLKEAKASGMDAAMQDRLLLNESRLEGIARDVRTVASLPDPIGEIIEGRTLPNGLVINKKRVPFGVIATIYESRPNVTIDISALSLKSGNAIILRGGKEAVHSNSALVEVIHGAIAKAGIPEGAVQFMENTDRVLVDHLLKMNKYVDLIIPRGGAGLIANIRANATMPVIAAGDSVCHTYVEKTADIAKAVAIAYNAKVQRPSVCNALDTLLVDKEIAAECLPKIAAEWAKAGVEMHCDKRALAILKKAGGSLKLVPATDKDWGKEFLSLTAAIKVVDSLDEALEHIANYGSGADEAIVTEDYTAATCFLNEVDAACVYVNASTRFTDGGQFGFGGEVAISTQKFHARGPMGLRELTTYKWIIYGSGQVRT